MPPIEPYNPSSSSYWYPFPEPEGYVQEPLPGVRWFPPPPTLDKLPTIRAIITPDYKVIPLEQYFGPPAPPAPPKPPTAWVEPLPPEIADFSFYFNPDTGKLQRVQPGTSPPPPGFSLKGEISSLPAGYIPARAARPEMATPVGGGKGPQHVAPKAAPLMSFPPKASRQQDYQQAAKSLKDYALSWYGRGLLGGLAGAGVGAGLSALSEDQRKNLIRNALIGLIVGGGLGAASSLVW